MFASNSQAAPQPEGGFYPPKTHSTGESFRREETKSCDGHVFAIGSQREEALKQRVAELEEEVAVLKAQLASAQMVLSRQNSERSSASSACPSRRASNGRDYGEKPVKPTLGESEKQRRIVQCRALTARTSEVLQVTNRYLQCALQCVQKSRSQKKTSQLSHEKVALLVSLAQYREAVRKARVSAHKEGWSQQFAALGQRAGVGMVSRFESHWVQTCGDMSGAQASEMERRCMPVLVFMRHCLASRSLQDIPRLDEQWLSVASPFAAAATGHIGRQRLNQWYADIQEVTAELRAQCQDGKDALQRGLGALDMETLHTLDVPSTLPLKRQQRPKKQRQMAAPQNEQRGWFSSLWSSSGQKPQKEGEFERSMAQTPLF